MPDLPNRKVGIVACSGEELAEGTVSRLAALKVLHALRPHDTVTICLPLFLAGGAGDRAFARLHPTITVDGCARRCAARATEMYSSKPSASIVINELVAEQGLGKPEGPRRLNEAGKRAVDAAAERLAALVDAALGKEPPAADGGGATTAAAAAERGEGAVTCSCGSGVPILKVAVRGKMVDVVALPLIFQKFREENRGADEAAARELFETVRIYNDVPPEVEAEYREAVIRDYAAFLKTQD